MKELVVLALVASARAGVFLQSVPEAGASTQRHEQDVYYNFAFNEKPRTSNSWRRESGAAGNAVVPYGLAGSDGRVPILNYGASGEPGVAAFGPAGVDIRALSGPTGAYIGGGAAVATAPSPFAVPSPVAVPLQAPHFTAPAARVVAAPGVAGVSAVPHGAAAASFGNTGPAPSINYAIPASAFAAPTDEYAAARPAASPAPAYGGASRPPARPTIYSDAPPAAPAGSSYGAARASRATGLEGAPGASPADSTASATNATDDATTAAAARAYGFVRLAEEVKFKDKAAVSRVASIFGATPEQRVSDIADSAASAAAARAYGFSLVVRDAKFAKDPNTAPAAPRYAASSGV